MFNPSLPLSRMNLPSRNSPCCINTAIAASRPLNEVPIMPTRQGGMRASIRPDHGLGKNVRVASSSSGQTWPVAITARSNLSANVRSLTEIVTPVVEGLMSVTFADSWTSTWNPSFFASLTIERKLSRKYSPNRSLGRNCRSCRLALSTLKRARWSSLCSLSQSR